MNILRNLRVLTVLMGAELLLKPTTSCSVIRGLATTFGLRRPFGASRKVRMMMMTSLGGSPCLYTPKAPCKYVFVETVIH